MGLLLRLVANVFWICFCCVVAVGAFALVITMDMTRRDNDKKILAVKIQMQELMAVFFEYVDFRILSFFSTPREV